MWMTEGFIKHRAKESLKINCSTTDEPNVLKRPTSLNTVTMAHLRGGGGA